MGDILSFLQDFDIAKLLPAPDKFANSLEGWVRLLVLLAPLVVLGLGLWYRYAPPDEANHKAGFRTYWSMGSVQAWRYAQRIAGVVYTFVGGGLAVLMLIVSLFFNGNKAMGMITAAFICIVIEMIVIIGAWFWIQRQIYKNFDKDGNPRKL